LAKAKHAGVSHAIAASGQERGMVGADLTPLIPKFPARGCDAASAQQFRRQRQALLLRFGDLEQMALLSSGPVASELKLLRQCFKDDPFGLWGYALKSLSWLGKNMRLRNGTHATWKDLGDIAHSITVFLDAWIATPPTKQTVHMFVMSLQHQKMLLAAGIEVEQAALRYAHPRRRHGTQPEN
jgi:hypothetical protein